MCYKTTLGNYFQFKSIFFLPILALLLCNTSLQGKVSFNQNFVENEQSSSIYTILSSTTDKKLNSIKENLENDLHGTLIQFSDIKRNKQQKLTSLTISSKFEDENDYRKNISITSPSTFPIQLSSIGKNLLVQYEDKSIIYISKQGLTYNEKSKDDKFTPKNTNLKSSEIYALQSPNLNKNLANSIDNQGKPLFFIDGKKATGKEINELEESKIEKIVVIKDKNATKKYGKKAKNGVIEITLKKEK